MSRLLRPSLALLTALLLALGSAPEATAETVVLKSGKKIIASQVKVEGDKVRATLAVQGGTAVITYGFDRLEPMALLELLERHLIVGVDRQADALAALRISAVAQGRDLLDEAVVWLVRAAEIDPAMAAKRDVGLEGIRMSRVRGALGVLEDLMRTKKPGLLVAAADEALSGELALILTPAEALRLSALRAIAQKMVNRAAGVAIAPAGAAAGAPVLPAAGGAPLPAALGAQVKSALLRVDAAAAKALAAREKATDPKISNPRARRLLETAAKSLLDARRLLRGLPQPLPEVALDRSEAITGALIVTWLDIADLYRETLAFGTARRFLRAVRLLDPSSERAGDIEDRMLAMRREDTSREQTQLDWIYSPSPYVSYFGRSAGSRYGHSTLGFHRLRHYGFHIGGHGHHHRTGSRRVVGTRR